MAVDYFFKLDTVQGESNAQNHTNEIAVHSWSWGGSNVSSVSGTGGSGAGRVSLSEFTLMKDFDKASPQLFGGLVKGTHYANGVLTAVKTGASNAAFLTVTFTELFVTSQQLSASSEIPSESVSFTYKTCKILYSVQATDGTLTAQNPITYDVSTNVAT